MLALIRKKLCHKSRSYQEIQYSELSTPTENSKRLLHLLEQDFKFIRNRTDKQCLLFGRFMSLVLLVERKLERLLISFDSDIESCMFGQKINVYKDFLKAINWDYIELDIVEFRELIAPMKEIKNIRNAMSHDLAQVSFSYEELSQTVSYIQRKRPDLAQSFSECEDEQVRCIGAIAVFGFVYSEQLAGLQQRLQ